AIAANPSKFGTNLKNFVGHALDLFIPGNAFDSRTGFDASNVVTTILNNMIPVFGPLGNMLGFNLVDKLLEAISDKLPDWVPDWAKNLIKDHVEDQRKQQEKNDKTPSTGQSSGGGGGFGGINYGSFDQTGRTTDGLGLGQNFLDSRTPSIGVGG